MLGDIEVCKNGESVFIEAIEAVSGTEFEFGKIEKETPCDICAAKGVLVIRDEVSICPMCLRIVLSKTRMQLREKSDPGKPPKP